MASVESRIVDFARNAGFPDGVSRRAFLSVAAAAGITVGVAACSSPQSGPASGGGGSSATAGGLNKTKSYSQITTLSNDFFVAFNEGAKQCTAALGVPLATFEDQGNVNTALSQIGNVKTAGDRSIFGTPATEAEAAAVIKACQTQGIYYGSAYTAPAFFTPADADKWVRFLTPASVTIAYATAKALFNKVNGEGTIIHVPGQKGSSADDQRTAGFTKALSEFPNIKVVTTSPGNWTAEDARKAFSNTLPSVKDFVGVFAQNDSEAAGVIAALGAKNITGKVVTGFDGNKQNIEYIAAGKQFLTSATIGGLTGGLLAVGVFDALNGIEFALPERFLFQGAVLVDPSSADAMLKSVYTAPLPFDWAKMSRALHPSDWDPQTLLTPIDPKDFFAGATPGQYQLNQAWAQAESTIPKVKQDLADHFKSGPLFPFKSQMV